MTKPITDAEAAAVPLVVADSTGKGWTIAPLTRRDLGHLLQWARSMTVAIGRGQIGGSDLDAEEKRVVLDAAWDRAMRIGLESDDFEAYIGSPDGMNRIVWQSLRRNYPEITEDDVDAMTNADVATLAEAVMKLTRPSSAKGGAADADPKSGDPGRRLDLPEAGAGVRVDAGPGRGPDAGPGRPVPERVGDEPAGQGDPVQPVEADAATEEGA